MNRKSVLRLLSSIIVVALFSVGLYKLTELVERKLSKTIYNDFYRQREPFDVLFLGTSHPRDGIYPMELWKEFGVISYNLGGPANAIPTSYWTLINALDYTTPKLVVFDCYLLREQVKYARVRENAHIALDSIPFSMNKIRTVLDLFSDTVGRLEFLFNFVIYHERIKQLRRYDFYPNIRKEKGAISVVGVAQPAKIPTVAMTQKFEGDSVGISYLTKVIDVCRKKNIKLLLTYYPFPADEDRIRESHRTAEIAKMQKIDFLGWEELKNIVDFDIDCRDSDSHLNPSGARKITYYLGQYITEHFGIQDHRNDPKYASWHKDYQEYTQFKIDTIKEQKSLKNVLMLLSDHNCSYAVYFPNERLYQNKIIMKLLRNTGADVEQIYFQSPNLIVVDNKKKSVSYRKVNENSDSSFGKLSVKNVKDGRSFMLNGKELLKIKNGERLEAAILVFDNETGKQVVAGKYQSL